MIKPRPDFSEKVNRSLGKITHEQAALYKAVLIDLTEASQSEGMKRRDLYDPDEIETRLQSSTQFLSDGSSCRTIWKTKTRRTVDDILPISSFSPNTVR